MGAGPVASSPPASVEGSSGPSALGPVCPSAVGEPGVLGPTGSEEAVTLPALSLDELRAKGLVKPARGLVPAGKEGVDF